jgi:hypothetical protein
MPLAAHVPRVPHPGDVKAAQRLDAHIGIAISNGSYWRQAG